MKNKNTKISHAAAAGVAAPLLAGFFYFLAQCLCGPSSIKTTAAALIVLSLAVGLFCFATLRDRLTLPVLVLALVCVMGGISTSYAVSGKFALQEFLKLLCAFCLVLILLSLCRGKDPARAMAQVLATCSAFAGLVSIDLLSTRVISGLFQLLMSPFTPDYADMAGVEAGIRMVSIFENANIFAGVAGLGVLLSLSLAVAEEPGSRRAFHTCLLYINSLAFVLAFSMGASGAIALAFLAYLLLEQTSRRPGTLVLMVETLVLVILPAFLISVTSFQTWDGAIRPVPMLCAIVGTAALCLLDRYAGVKVAGKLKGKAVLVVILALLCALAVFVLAAYHWTSGADLAAGERLRRAIYPQPGSYTLVADEVPVSVSVESQDQRETMMHTSTTLYRGPLSGAAFTVPEDSLVVYLNFYADGDAALESVTCQGEESYKVPLNYPLLPGFIANRLQGLWANENAIQRFVFFADGMKLFHRSPVVGLGLGAFENGIRSVQSFDYETKYAHNHYIQSLVETGVVGLVLFLALLGVSALAVVLTRWKKKDGEVVECHPLVPALGAALVFMAVHAATEVVFSTYPYLPVAFGVFGLIGLCCGQVFSFKWLGKVVRTVLLGVIAALLMTFGVLLMCNTMARSMVTQQPTMNTLVTAAATDPFEWADYALSYVNNTLTAETVDKATMDQADEFAEKLAKVDSNTIPVYLAEYYFRTDRPEEALKMIDKYVNYVSSRASAWQTAFDLMERYEEDTDAYRREVVRIGQMLETWNAENMGTITLSEQSQAFLARMGQ